jgi:hypothetical protein
MPSKLTKICLITERMSALFAGKAVMDHLSRYGQRAHALTEA